MTNVQFLVFMFFFSAIYRYTWWRTPSQRSDVFYYIGKLRYRANILARLTVLVFYIVSVTETSDMLVSNSVLVGSLPELTANQLCAQHCVVHWACYLLGKIYLCNLCNGKTLFAFGWFIFFYHVIPHLLLEHMLLSVNFQRRLNKFKV